jgi:dTDP-4-amino-4,6-dideoxygalactose transaminase
MKKIPVGDFFLGPDEKQAIMRVLDQGRLSEGAITHEFEQLFAKYIGTKYCVATSSGTAALICLLTGLIIDERYPRFRKGMKVITSPLTYVATTNAIILTGLVPVFADVDRNTFGILPEKVEEILSEGNPDEFCAILPVHLIGYPCRMDELQRISDAYGLVLLEDAAQAHGSVFQGKRCGSIGLAGAFSFYIAHNIQAGEMGCVTTDDARIAGNIKKIKSNGRECDCAVCRRSVGECVRMPFKNEPDRVIDMDPRFRHEIIGYNFKVMEFQPALGITQLKKADAIFRSRLKNVEMLNRKLEKHSEILALPQYDEQVSYLAYPLAVKEKSGVRRSDLRANLERLGVETRPLFGCIPIHQPAYAEYRDLYMGKLLNAEHLGRHAFYIGCHQYLNEEDIGYIAEAMGKALEHALSS